MTVTALGEDSVDCLWLGEEGELFRESIPSVALMIGSDPVDEEEDDDEVPETWQVGRTSSSATLIPA